MKKFITASTLGALVFSLPFVWSTVSATTVNSEQERGYISVSYTAEKEVSPDTVEISIAIKTDDKKSMQEAVRKNKEISDKVYSYVKSFINTDSHDYVKTSNFSASPNYLYNNGKREFDKYVVSNNVIVHTKNIDKISTLIDKSLALGATNVDSLNFTLSEKDEECNQLLNSASTQVRKRADIVASATGTSITGVRSIDTSCSVNRNGNVGFARNTMLLKAASADGAVKETSPNIESGVIKIYSNVNATFFVK
jgi:hypothetical protein